MPLMWWGSTTPATPPTWSSRLTVLDAIGAALQTIGVIGAGDPIDDSIGAAALERFQDLIDSFGADRMLVAAVTPVTKALAAGQDTYTIGVGGDIDIVWPYDIDHGGILLPNTNPAVEMPIAILTDNEWADVSTKLLQSGSSFAGYYSRTFPLGRFSLYPVPNVSGLTLVLYVPTALVVPATFTTVITVAPGNRRMFRYNLASELADEFGAVGPHIDRINAKAVATMAAVKQANNSPNALKGRPEMAAGGGSAFNIWTGQ